MATTKPVWSTEQTGFSNTISQGGNGDTDIDLDTNGWDAVSGVITVALSSASSVTVELYRSTDGGTSFSDDQSLAGGFQIDADGEYPLPDILIESFVRVRVVNNDGSNPTGTITITYQGRQWDTQ